MVAVMTGTTTAEPYSRSSRPVGSTHQHQINHLVRTTPERRVLHGVRRQKPSSLSSLSSSTTTSLHFVQEDKVDTARMDATNPMTTPTTLPTIRRRRCWYHGAAAAAPKVPIHALLCLLVVVTAPIIVDSFMFQQQSRSMSTRISSPFTLSRSKLVAESYLQRSRQCLTIKPSTLTKSAPYPSMLLLSTTPTPLEALEEYEEAALLSSSTTPSEDSSVLSSLARSESSPPVWSGGSDENQTTKTFDMSTALFCAGLAFDSYVEPSPTSSRWERGSRGMNVAFVSQAFTKSLYKGLVEITPLEVRDLPDNVKETKLAKRPTDGMTDDKTSSSIGVVESLATGDGVDACIYYAAVESKSVPEDLDILKQKRHAGVWELSGAAHVGKTATAWSNVRLQKSTQAAQRDGVALPYHVPSSWGKAAKAIWPENDRSPKSGTGGSGNSNDAGGSTNVIPGQHDFRYYIYVQDPATVQLLFTLQDDDVIGNGTPISSTTIPLSQYLPQVKYTQDQLIDQVKTQLMSKIKAGQIEPSMMSLLTGSGGSGSTSDGGSDGDSAQLQAQPPTRAMLDEQIMSLLAQNLGSWEGDLKLDVAPPRASKTDQMALGAAAGAWLAGPVGAAAGAAVGLLYDGPPRGVLKVRMRYLPIISSPTTPQQKQQRQRYKVFGGMPGIFWGDVYEQYLRQQLGTSFTPPSGNMKEAQNKNPILKLGGEDLEHCFFINHEKTGASCAVYRSLEQRLICVSFRGTCQPIDLVTDASIFQDPWVDSPEYTEEELSSKSLPKVHGGFRRSMNSISRRLKELILATVAEGENLSQYDVLVTGHSLGGALATLFVADVAEFGFDAGRALPQKEPSDEWWRAIANTFMGQQASDEGDIQNQPKDPPRPRSLRMYNFGSPRVGNPAFADKFELLIEQGRIDQAYRVVNSQDVVARVPRPMMGIDYEHCGRTVLIEEPLIESTMNDVDYIEKAGIDPDPTHVLWVEGESDFVRVDPVRDVRNITKGILSQGSLFDELYRAYKKDQGNKQEGEDINEGIVAAASAISSGTVDEGSKDAIESLSSSPQLLQQFSSMAARISQITITDLTSVIGLDRSYAERELQLARSVLKGEALAHHMEDSYYAAMRRAIGMKVEEPHPDSS